MKQGEEDGPTGEKFQRQPSEDAVLSSETPSDIRYLSSEYVDQIVSGIGEKQAKE